MSAKWIDELRQVVGADYTLTNPVDLSVYDRDGETLDVATPDCVVLPASTEEVSAVVKIAVKHGIPFAPRGAGTGLSGGSTAIAGGLIIALTRLTRIHEIDPVNLIARVDCGATNLSVSIESEKYGLYFAPDPSSQVASTIGGNLAENAGGPHCLKYGMTTDHILGITAVLANGEITTFGGKARDRAGLDLLGVFVGSEGTLGLATEAIVRLVPRPQSVETMLAYFGSVESAGQAVSDIVAAGVVPAAMEMIDRLTLNAVEDAHKMGLNRAAEALLIVELDGPSAGIAVHRLIVEECLAKNGVEGVQWAKDANERMRIWKARKSAFGALGRIAPHAYVLDGVIPRSKLAQAITLIGEIGARRNVTIANVYHAGDGNLHPTLMYHKNVPAEVEAVLIAGREILEMCVELGGTLSGEHGIGIEKVMEMHKAYSEQDLEAMRWVKHAFNDNGLCNPGKVLPTPKSCGESGNRAMLRHNLSAINC